MATQAELARHISVAQQTVSRLKNAGVIPAPAARGGYDLDACRGAYIEHLRRSAAGRDSSRPGSLEAERARLASAQAEQVERRNAVERGELGSVAELRDTGAGVIALIVGQLQQVGARVARGDVKLRKRIEAAVHEVPTDLSMTRIEDAMANGFNDAAAPEDG